MLTDKEMLALSAKAADYHFEWGAQPMILAEPADFERPWRLWNPLTDDGDALRLAVKCDIYFMVVREQGHIAARIRNGPRSYWNVQIGGDEFAATRRAIVRAAAAIGKTMP